MSRFPSNDVLEARRLAARTSVMAALPPRRSHRAVVIVASSVGAAALLTAGTIAVQRATQEEVSYSAECYAQASTSGEKTTVAVAEAVSADGAVSRDEVDPVELCGEMWRMGLLGQEQRPADPNAADFPVPTLTACELPNGVGAAFPAEGTAATLPADEFCAELNLTAW